MRATAGSALMAELQVFVTSLAKSKPILATHRARCGKDSQLSKFLPVSVYFALEQVRAYDLERFSETYAVVRP